MPAYGALLTMLMSATVVAPLPAPAFVMEALDSVTVTHSDHSDSGFQLTFHADRTRMYTPDYDLLLTRALSTGTRVVLVVTLPGRAPQTLSDGFITNMQVSHSRAAGGATITVSGEDVSAFMNLVETSEEFPGLGDAAIVAELLEEYVPLLGLTPVVVPPPTSIVSNPLERTPVKRVTDRAHIRELAGRHGHVFIVRPGPAPATNIAYWGPPLRFGAPLTTLTVDMGSATNVESINFSYAGSQPEQVYGVVQDAETEAEVPFSTMASLRMPPLALEPALLTNGAFVRRRLFDKTGFALADALAYAQGLTDLSTDRVVTAEGEVDAFRYGEVITAPGLVCVRGCGLSYDGAYRVTHVSHSLKRGEFKQSFGLAREGLMTTLPAVPPS